MGIDGAAAEPLMRKDVALSAEPKMMGKMGGRRLTDDLTAAGPLSSGVRRRTVTGNIELPGLGNSYMKQLYEAVGCWSANGRRLSDDFPIPPHQRLSRCPILLTYPHPFVRIPNVVIADALCSLDTH